jgi:hypothetical protein
MATTTVPSEALTYAVVVTNGKDMQAWSGPAEQCSVWAREMSARDHTLTCSVWVINGQDKTELETYRAGELVASRQPTAA